MSSVQLFTSGGKSVATFSVETGGHVKRPIFLSVIDGWNSEAVSLTPRRARDVAYALLDLANSYDERKATA